MPKGNSKRKQDAEDLELVRRTIQRLRAIEPKSWRPIEEAQALAQDLADLHDDRFVRLFASVPGAVLPSPHPNVRAPGASAHPVHNLLRCYDLCVGCVGEAIRGLQILEASLASGAAPSEFMDPTLARQLTQQRAESEARARLLERDRPRPPLLRAGAMPLGEALISRIAIPPSREAAAVSKPRYVPRATSKAVERLPDGAFMVRLDGWAARIRTTRASQVWIVLLASLIDEKAGCSPRIPRLVLFAPDLEMFQDCGVPEEDLEHVDVARQSNYLSSLRRSDRLRGVLEYLVEFPPSVPGGSAELQLFLKPQGARSWAVAKARKKRSPARKSEKKS